MRSVTELETLLLSSRQPGVFRTAKDVSLALYLSENGARDHLDWLRRCGFLDSRAGQAGEMEYCYAPRQPEMREWVSELTLVYEQRRVRVIEFIYSGPSESVRGFARAFRISRDDDE